jgi:ketosteroid isomerase-like protein
MSHESTLRNVYDALNNKDTSRIKDVLTEDAIFHILPNPVLPPQTLTGRDDILSFIDQQITGIDMQQEIDEVAVNGDFAVVYVKSESKGEDGSPLTVRWADLFRFEGDRIREHVSLSA